MAIREAVNFLEGMLWKSPGPDITASKQTIVDNPSLANVILIASV
jgi:hypothetical protein